MGLFVFSMSEGVIRVMVTWGRGENPRSFTSVCEGRKEGRKRVDFSYPFVLWDNKGSVPEMEDGQFVDFVMSCPGGYCLLHH